MNNCWLCQPGYHLGQKLSEATGDLFSINKEQILVKHDAGILSFDIYVSDCLYHSCLQA